MSNVQIQPKAFPASEAVTWIPARETDNEASGIEVLEEMDASKEISPSFFSSWKWTAAKIAGVVLALAFIHQAGVHTGTYHTSSLACEASKEKQACIEDLARRSLESMPLTNDGLLRYVNQAATKALAFGSNIFDASLTTVKIFGNVAWVISLVVDHPVESISFSLFSYVVRKPVMGLFQFILGKTENAGLSLLTWSWSIAKGGWSFGKGNLGFLLRKVFAKKI